MNNYLAKILELGIDQEGAGTAGGYQDVVNLTEKQTKQIISEKLISQGGKKKNKRKKDNNHGMTDEEMIAEQQRLFQNAREYNYEDEDEDDSLNQLQHNQSPQQQQ